MKTLLLATAAAIGLADRRDGWTGLERMIGWPRRRCRMKGAPINVIFLDRPGYRAIETLLPDFEKRTGLKVNFEVVPYENTREKEVLNFNSQGELTIALVDLVWIGEYAENGWILPIDKFASDAVDHRSQPEPQGVLSRCCCRRSAAGAARSTACRSTTIPACCSTTSASSRMPALTSRRPPGPSCATPTRRS